MKKVLLLTLLFALFTSLGFAQTGRYWFENKDTRSNIKTDKAVARLSFPKEFRLFDLDLALLRQELFTVVDNQSSHATIISLPNAAGYLEQFEVFEASNFEPALQAQFPEIRAFSGKGITDKYATLKLSISPQGIQTMVFRTDKENEFIEPYSQDHRVYAVFNSHRTPGQLPWTCSTNDVQIANDISSQVALTQRPESSAGQLKTMRLAQSVTAEYSNFFGATSSAQVNLVLAAINATLTRCNGCYEKDLAVHLNLIANTTSVIYYNASTDPYSNASTGAGGAWNSQLQNTLTSVIGEANYDIGHLFGASGGGGNAGCIGCVCTNGSKGSGFTSPADGIPQGDNFDIDYVVHEVGHQMGANHTFSHSNESTSVQKEVGSGITIMGYAGITSQDVAPHSIDIYHEASIAQIQSNLAGKSCPVTTTITANNATPVVAAVGNYTIPKSTPFALTGSATDENAGDVLTYCWEQNDNATTFGTSSVASATKATGPNWISFSPTISPTRYFPKLATILAGGLISGPLPGGDASANTEALSSVARTLHFRLTVRDNSPYSSTAPVKVGQTSFTDMTVTVSTASGPFSVTSPNTAVSWPGNSIQTITWAVASTTAAPVSCANVKISLSTDGGQTFPTVLSASTANDGTEALTIPNTATNTARIKVEAIGNIFFDISNTNFTITGTSGLTTISTSAINPSSYCAGAAVSVPFTTNGAANAGNVFTAQLSNAAGSFTNPVAIGTLSSTAAGIIPATIPAGTAAGNGYRIRVVSSAPSVTGSDNGSNITVNVIPTADAISAGGPTTFCQGGSVLLSGNSGGTWSMGGGTTSTLTATASGDYFVTNTNGCGSVQSNHITVTVNPLPTAATISAGGPTTFCQGGTVLLSGNSGGTWSVGGGTTSTLTATASGDYFITNTNGCGSVQSNHITVTVNPLPTAATISAGGPTTFCQGGSVLLSGNSGGTWSVGGGTTSTLTATASGDYFVTNTNGCGSIASNHITVTVNPLPVSSAISSGGATTFCEGKSVILTGNVGGVWSPGGTTGTALTVSTSGDYFVTNTNGCGSVQSNHITVTVNPLPSVSFSGLAASYSVSAGNVTLTGSPAGGTFSGTGISGNTFSPSSAGTGGPYTITYTFTNANGCTNLSSQQTTVAAACTVPKTPGTISTVGGTVKVCPGDIKTYTIAAVSGATSYTWTAPPGGVVSSGQGTTSATIAYNAGFIAGDSLRVTANNSCGSSIAKALRINRNAIAGTPSAITGAATGVCNNNGVPYSVTSVAGNTYAWSWNVADASIASGQGSSAITADFAGSFVTAKISVTASNACGTSPVRSLTVYARPATPASISGPASVCALQSGVPYSIAPLNNASSYTWYGPTGSHISDGVTLSSGGSLVTTATNVTVNFGSAQGQVRVKGINACAAGGLASLTVAFTCRENTEPVYSASDGITAYPNPSNGDFRIITGNVQKVSTVKIGIMNQFGQVVYQGNQSCNNGVIEMKFANQLTDGIYMISCIINGQKTVKKLLISK